MKKDSYTRIKRDVQPILLLIMLLFISLQSISAQSDCVEKIVPIPNPPGHDAQTKGYRLDPIIYSGKLYLGSEGNDSNWDLFSYDGSTLTQIPSSPSYNNADRGYRGDPIIYNETLYLRYQDNDDNYDLFSYDGSTLTPIPSPANYDNAFRGYRGDPIIYNETLYLRYQDNDGNYELFSYDGTTLTPIPSPANYDNDFRGYFGDPIIYNGKLYLRYQDNDGNYDLFSYDGSTLTPIPSPTDFDNSSRGYNGLPIEYNGKLYLNYEGNDENYDLFSYNGSTLTLIPSPTDYTDQYRGYRGSAGSLSPIVYNGILYLQYQGNDGNYDLFSYDGMTLSHVTTPSGYDGAFNGYRGNPPEQPIIYDGKLYLHFSSNSGTQDLMSYDGTNLIHIPSPPGFAGLSGAGYRGNPIVFNGKLYMDFNTDTREPILMSFDGTNFNPFPNPAGYSGYSGFPIDYAGNLYLRINSIDRGWDLAVFDDCSELTELPTMGFWSKVVLVLLLLIVGSVMLVANMNLLGKS